MSDKGWVKKMYIPNKPLPFSEMDWQIKIRSQLKQFNDNYVLSLSHACKAEEVADWWTKKGIASNEAISETIHLLRKSKNNDHYYENDIKKLQVHYSKMQYLTWGSRCWMVR